MAVERWRPVPGFPRYEVSDRGRLRNPESGRVLTTPVGPSSGYPQKFMVISRPPRRGSTQLVHRLVALAFLPPPPVGTQVNHKNGIKTDNRASNLEWVTPSENHRHAFDTGLRQGRPGEASATAKLTEQEVRQIRRAYTTGATQKELAARYGISRSGIGAIVTGKRWAYIHAEPEEGGK